MSLSGSLLSEIHSSLPKFEIVKDKIGIEGMDIDSAIERVSSLFDDAIVDKVDGIKFTWDDRWVHLRRSNTEPIMRIYAEAPDREQALKLVSQIKKTI
jgi:phosphomannomutase